MPDPTELLAQIADHARTDPVWALFMEWARHEYAQVCAALETEHEPALLYRLQGRALVWRRILDARDELRQQVLSQGR